MNLDIFGRIYYGSAPNHWNNYATTREKGLYRYVLGPLYDKFFKPLYDKFHKKDSNPDPEASPDPIANSVTNNSISTVI